MPDVTYPLNGQEAPGYLAVPGSGSGPATIVLQEWWGLDHHIKDVCDRLAVAGFLALAPDLFRGETADQPDEAEHMMMVMSMDQAELDMRAAVDYLAAHEGLGKRRRLARLLPRRRAVGVGGHGQPARRRGRHLLLPDGRKARFRASTHRCSATSARATSSSPSTTQGPRAGDGERGRQRPVRVLRGCGHAFFNDTDRLGTTTLGPPSARGT